ncbi:MAG: sigma-70 family RNA polymerase sigma factor [Gemmatales bacterium]|nr:sigma-70 family RNA polymerase sigma factor [Gemmatales bacterium]MDW8387498.1 sigma-70 family RNA polymerase sigma factor [Gemmatales bacterium]
MLGFGPRISVAQLVERYYASLYRYAYRLSGSQADAEDLTQETFLRATAKLGQLRDPDKARPWLFSILRHAYLQRQRNSQQAMHVSLDDINDVADAIPDPLPEVDPEALRKALDELPEAFRSAVILFYFEDLSYREIAEILEIPIGTVMSRLARAKNQLKARLMTPNAVLSPTTRKGRSADGL